MPQIRSWHIIIAFVVLAIIGDLTTGIVRKAAWGIVAVVAVLQAFRAFRGG